MPSYVAAFRTHVWDEEVAHFAERFFAVCPGARQVVLADETHGVLDIPYEKVSHTDRSGEALGLPGYIPGSVLWFSGDYGLYFLLDRLPDYDYYVMSEFDIALNISLDVMIEQVAADGIDVVLHQIQPARPDWAWYQNGAALFDDPWRCLLFFMVASRRAVWALLDARLDLAIRLAGKPAEWPFCETFIPSVLKALPDMRFAEAGRFADVSALQFRPRLSWRDPRTSAPGSIAHPVLGTRRFIAAMLFDRPVAEYFEEGSELRTSLAIEDVGVVLPAVRDALIRARDDEGLARLKGEMIRHGLPVPVRVADLAYNKPALSSSVCMWSDSQDVGRDAGGANGEWLPPEFGFHTDHERHPWWLVDLLDEHVVDRVEITNRRSFPERFVKFRIDSSRDGGSWVMRYLKIDEDAVSNDPDRPWSHSFGDPFVARHVRVTLLGTGLLHLRRVQVFGRAIVAA